MSKQHDTFPDEQPEMPVPRERPEINQPTDPKTPEIPKENPQIIPDDVPWTENTPESPAIPPGQI